MRGLRGGRHGIDAHGRSGGVSTGLGETIPAKIPVRYHLCKTTMNQWFKQV
ncbi:hypothetical protein GLE_5194 [Lysobacter enzymogenes]|uniref:Uncharacterized protein n=1 Tax=Lysobacter enzymogenes TaxID=69 RepID=A0A0S2DPJ1_LYSEN|nr:hypothetical protein GLE_5194 [Lysobacter enzymogenes]